MFNYDILDNVDVTERKYDMQDWMISEKLYNCGGFASTYYKDLISGVISRIRLFRKKAFNPKSDCVMCLFN